MRLLVQEILQFCWKKLFYPIGQSGEASRWKVCYQWGLPHKEISLAHIASQTKQTVQQRKLCWHGVLECGLGPRLITRTVINLEWRFWSKGQSSSSSNVNKAVHEKQCSTASKTKATWQFTMFHDASWPFVDYSSCFVTFLDSFLDFLKLSETS